MCGSHKDQNQQRRQGMQQTKKKTNTRPATGFSSTLKQ